MAKFKIGQIVRDYYQKKWKVVEIYENDLGGTSYTLMDDKGFKGAGTERSLRRASKSTS